MGARVLRILAVIVGVLLVGSPGALAADPECTRPNGPAPKPAQAQTSSVELTIEPDKDLVNFAGGRGTKPREFVVSPKSNGKLPDALEPAQIELRTVRSFNRTGDKIESVSLVEPVQFTEPEINRNDNEIRFSACFDLKGSKAGSYTGQVRIAGPGLQRASVPVTVNAQNRSLFLVGLAFALAAVLIVFGIRKIRSSQAWIPFLSGAIVSLVAAGYAMYRVYAGDPAWGADTFESVLTLTGAGLSAAGLKATIDAIAPGNTG
jgi:hypothetical protein